MAVITFAISASTVFIALQVSWSSFYDPIHAVHFQDFSGDLTCLQLFHATPCFFSIHSLHSASSYTSWPESWASLRIISCLSFVSSCHGSAWLTPCSAPESTASLRSEVSVWEKSLCWGNQQHEYTVHLKKTLNCTYFSTNWHFNVRCLWQSLNEVSKWKALQ